MNTDSSVHLVKAIYDYKANHTDELNLKKGDVITVARKLDGGWWEGTLNDVTGWFPSNYVKNFKTESLKFIDEGSKVPLSPNLNDSRVYREIVFQDIIDTEQNHLTESENFLNQYLEPLKDCEFLSKLEYNILISNYEEAVASSKALFLILKDVKNFSSSAQKIGAEFLTMSACIENIYMIYSSYHPKSAAVIEKHKDALSKFMEEQGALPPGVLTLTTGLSRPFRRLEKYPALLTELLHHTPENHIDRGNTQRAAMIYRDIANTCSSKRKQKQTELEILSGNIKDWEGEPIHTLGNIIHMGSVLFLSEDQQKSSRFLVAFPDVLVILSVKNGFFVFEGKLQISALTVRKLNTHEGHPHAFELISSVTQSIVVICPFPDALNQWLSVFRFHNVRELPSSLKEASTHSSPSQVRTSLSPVNSTVILPSSQPHSSRSLSPDSRGSTSSNRIAAAARQVTKKVWPNWNLRPHPPMRASLTSQNEVKLRRTNSYKKEKDHDSEGDLPVRQFLDAFNNYERTRNTMPAATHSAPPRLNFDEDKIIINGLDGNDTVIQEKTLVDTIYMLKDQIQALKKEVTALNQSLNEERKARKRLEAIIQKHFPSYENHSLTSLDG